MTPASDLVISELEPADTDSWEEYVRVQYTSFVGNNLHDYVYPAISTSSTKEEKKVIIDSVIERHRTSVKQTPSEICTYAVVRDLSQPSVNGKGAIKAGIKWIFYMEDDKTHPPTAVCTWHPDGSRQKQLADVVLDDFMGRRSSRMNGRHAIIDLLFTAPDAQRRGCGSMLIKWGCDKADELGLKAYVEASPQGTPLYARWGFKTRDVPVLELGDGIEPTSYAFMERDVVATTA